MSIVIEKAKREFQILTDAHLDKDNRPIIEPFQDEILAIVKKFSESGQSGGSAPYTAGAISQAVKKLCMQQPIGPVMNTDDEWNDVSGLVGSRDLYQNNRCSAIFKEGKDGTPHYIEAIVFQGDNSPFTSNGSVTMADGSKLTSKQYVKSFPFTPKTFYIDVIETEWADKEEKVKKVGGGWWTSVVKDESQLKEVFEYYNRYKVED